tara:strand:- start:5299 stop:6156 length:858 start_codon:yes stop_codon:yes gene_type:complete
MSIYGERFKLTNDHHIAHSAKLDAILAKNTELDLNTDGLEAKHDTGNASLSSIDGKVVACNTGAVVVASSALPAGAASEASLSALSAKVTACDSGAVVVASSALPAGAASESSLAALSAKVTACDSGAVVVASSALPSGAASEAKQDALIGHVDGLEALVGATNSALAGTLTVSAPAVVKSTQQPIVAQSIAAASTHSSAEIDLGNTKHLSIVASCGDTAAFHELDLLVSPSSGGVFFETAHSGFFSDGFFYVHATDIPFRFVKLRVKNTSGAADTFSAHLLSSA